MDTTNWLRQTPDKPAFPDLLWSRPENKRFAGKLLIAGGNSHSFAAVSTAYGASEKAGVGNARAMMPSSLERTLAKAFPESEFAASTPSGSFARTALGPMLDAAGWGDGVLLAGDFGRNSETQILLEGFVAKYSGLLCLAGDSLDYFWSSSGELLDRSPTTLVADLSQFQKLLAGTTLVKHSMDLVQLVNVLGNLKSEAEIITFHNSQIVVAASGQVGTTPAEEPDLTKLAAYASVWRLQQPSQPFEALTTAVFCLLSDAHTHK